MKVAIVGSQGITDINITDYLPNNTTEIVIGGESGVYTIAKEYAIAHNIKLTEFLQDFNAPSKLNLEIIEYADLVLVFWDGQSKGSKFIIDTCYEANVEVRIIHKL